MGLPAGVRFVSSTPSQASVHSPLTQRVAAGGGETAVAASAQLRRSGVVYIATVEAVCADVPGGAGVYGAGGGAVGPGVRGGGGGGVGPLDVPAARGVVNRPAPHATTDDRPRMSALLPSRRFLRRCGSAVGERGRLATVAV